MLGPAHLQLCEGTDGVVGTPVQAFDGHPLGWPDAWRRAATTQKSRAFGLSAARRFRSADPFRRNP